MVHHLRSAVMRPNVMRTLPILCLALALMGAAAGSASAQGFEQLGDPTRHTPRYDSGKEVSPLPQCAPGQADPDHTGCRPIEWIIQDEEMAAEADAPVATGGSLAPESNPFSGAGSSSDGGSSSGGSGSSRGGSLFGGGGSSGSRSKSPF